jgi:hypothetical protein
VLSRCRPILVLALLGIVFFAPLAVWPDALLYSDYSDFINYHVPCKYFLVRSWQQTGEVPLWCPEMFSGMPFVHDIQVAAFYPPHLPLYLLPEQHLGAACSWLIALHLLLAGVCMYAYARHQGLHGAGALVAALGFMFFGKWLIHVLVAGHYIFIPLAWLPLVLLWSEQAIERRSLVHATGAAMAFALIVLGSHPQLTLYCGLFIAIWTLGTVLGGPGAVPGSRGVLVRRWLLVGTWIAVVAALLSSIQLLPTLEATPESSRTLGVPVALDRTLTGGTRSLVGLVGPALTDDATWLWEDRAGLSLVWLALAVCAPVLAPQRSVRWQAGMTLLWLLLGLGGVLVLQWLPGFHMWRYPSRMFLLLGLPVGLLAGRAVQALVTDAALPDSRRQRCRAILLRTALYILIPLTVYALIQWQRGASLQFAPYWPSLVLTIPVAWWLLGSPMACKAAASERGPTLTQRLAHFRSSPFNYALAWVGVLLIDLWALGLPLVQVRSEAAVFASSACVQYVAGREGAHGRVLDIPARPATTSPLWPNFAMVTGLEPVRGYNPLDVRRYKEYEELIVNRDRPLEALKDFTEPYQGGFELRNAALGDLLGVRYLLLEQDVPLEQYVPDAAARAGWRRVFDDPAPHGYNFAPSSPEGPACGLVPLPAYTVYENSRVLPRVFVVGDAGPLPERAQVLAALCKTDLRTRVLLEGLEGAAPPAQAKTAAGDAVAVIRAYEPNHVAIDVDNPAPGWLVLTDIWYPGWTCTLDNEPVPIYRADFLFRAVQLPAGAQRIEFRFAPRSYQVGRMLTVGTLGLLLLGGVCWLVKGLVRRPWRSGPSRAAEIPLPNPVPVILRETT